jgi:hypothetical protein
VYPYRARLFRRASLALVACHAWAQTSNIAVLPPQPHALGFLTRPYRQRIVPPINLANSSRLATLIRAGNLYLTAQDLIALALENNIDIETQRYGPLLFREDLRRAQVGGNLRVPSTAIAAGPQSVSLADAKLRAELAAMQASSISNGLLPSLQVFATSSNVGQTGQAVMGASPDPYFVGGAGAALGQVFRRNFPNERVGARFSAQLESTQAQADHAMDQLTHRQTQLNAQKTFNQLAVDVCSQMMALAQARAQYRAATGHRTIVEKLLQGEERRFQMGASTIATVVGARRDLATAQSSELAAAAAYIHNRIALDQGLGLTLEANRISVEDAVSLSAR